MITVRAAAGPGKRHLSVAKGNAVSIRILMCLLVTLALGILWLITANAAADDANKSSAYKLGPGDQILINVFGEPDLSMDFQLNDTGTLNYPFLGELNVAGISVVELEQMISGGLKGPYLINPDVTISIKEYRPFYIYGEINKPGGFPYQPGLTMERAIALGGGFTERASKNKIMVIRASDPDRVVRSIEFNEPVFAGDVVTVHQSFF